MRVLGPLQVIEDGRLVPLGSRIQRAVLAMLVLASGEVVPRDRLIEAAWRGRPPPAVEASLNAYVSRLRSALGAERLQRRPSGYALRVTPDEIDAARFERLLSMGREALAEKRPADATQHLGTALALWRGGAYADVADEPFAQAEIARLNELALEAREERIEADLLLGRHQHVVAELERLVVDHPLRERLWRQLMLALYRSGRQAAALDAFRSARRVLLEEAGLEPGEELKGMQEAVLRRQVPSLEVGAPRIHLPAQLTPLIGRQQDVDTVTRLLRRHRLVTVTGLGGVGKTRLALAVAAAVAAGYEQVCFIDLSAVQGAGQMPYAMADALSVSGGADHPLVDALVRVLRPARVLLVVDNCEHVREPCAELIARLIGEAPGIVVLATSREPLGVPGEQAYALSPLPVPARDTPSEGRSDCPSVQLFLERAAAVRAGANLPLRATEAVAQICRDLDGIPLAIELAAARMTTLTDGEIAVHLDRRFDFLSSWRPAGTARQRTLRATMDWSHDLLSPEERHLLHGLSVFAGGFTLETAATTCLDGDLARALEGVRQLVARSLVVVEHGEGAPTRYRLLETVRRYAAEHLEASGRSAAVRRAHAQTFLRLAESACSAPGGGFTRLAAERANLRAALEWSFASGQDIGPTLAAVLAPFWLARHHLAEGRQSLERALAASGVADSLRARLRYELGGLLHEIGDLRTADATLDDALCIAIAADDRSLVLRIGIRLAEVRVMRGASDLADALVECEAAAAELERSGALAGLADALHVIGKFRYWLLRADDQEALERAAVLARETGNRLAELRATEWLAVSYCDLRLPVEVAIERQTQLLACVSGEPRAEAGIRSALAFVHGFGGRFAEARDALAAAVPVFAADFEWTLEWAGTAMVAGYVELLAGGPRAAESLLRPAYEALIDMGDVEYLAFTAFCLATSLYEQSLVDEAERVCSESMARVPQEHPISRAVCTLVAARVLARRGCHAEAEQLSEACVSALAARPRFRGEALLAQAEVLELAGQLGRAEETAAEALTLYEACHAAPLAARARARLEAIRQAASAAPGDAVPGSAKPWATISSNC